MQIVRKISLFILIITLAIPLHFRAEEGMYPISEIHKLNLAEKGLKISQEQIYNPSGVSLIDGIVKIGGCTGSFVSEKGLILTNHHCAYRAAQAASTEDHDYIRNGFMAEDFSAEIPAKGYTVRITESYRDVSAEVLSAVTDTMDFAQRTKAIEKKIKSIIKETEEKNPGKRAEVSEMFPGKTYVLFIYTYLKDVRLVYVPPRSIGEYGGEEDNWMWPRHNADFSFMRAYVAPDGTPADYSPENVPYQPRKVLKVNPVGVDEEDFVFILGYPGRTYRHRTSHYLAYEEEVRLPYVADLYQWEISVMEEMSKKGRNVAIKHLSRIKGLSNVMKNYRGKLKGLKRLHLVEKKREEEAKLQQFIEADPRRREQYGDLLHQIGRVYDEMRGQAPRELLLTYLNRGCYLLYFANTIYQGAIERAKPDIERESRFMDRNFDRTKKRLQIMLNDYYEPTDRIILKEMLQRAARLPDSLRISALEEVVGGDRSETHIDQFIEQAYRNSRLNDPTYVMELLEKSPEEIEKLNDPFIQLAKKIYPAYQELKETGKRRKGMLDELYARLIDVKQEFLQADFIPDANGTLRLTYGRIRGYSPADAVYYQPITSLKGVVEKNTGKEPFDAPARLIELYRKKDYGAYRHPRLNRLPVCILYNMDTTGGNSGSPVFDAAGQIVGLNFDRAFEATINDYAWSEAYSRSIGVDIRYVLWVLDKFSGANRLIGEMGIE